MIGSIEGVIGQKKPAWVRVVCGGIGCDVQVPMSTYETVGAVGEPVRFETYLHVKEDILQLYGFRTAEEKDVFLKVIGVRGIGPRIALGILSSLPVRRFIEALQAGDAAVLSEIPGVGRKTAERLVVDLKDRFPEIVAPVGRSDFRREEEEAIKALVALGFSATRARRAVRDAVGEEGAGGTDTEAIVKRALGRIR